MATIETTRLVLKPLENQHIKQYYPDWLNDPEVNQFLETRHTRQTLQSCIEFVNNCNNDVNSHLFAVYDKSSMTHIGNCKLGFINSIYQIAQISLFIGDKNYWNKGLGTEIIDALTTFGFNTLNLLRIEAGCYQDNVASLRAFLSNGYLKEGLLRSNATINGQRTNTYILGVLKDEFLHQKK